MIGWIGSLMLGFCGLPQALKSFRDKHSDGLDVGFLLLWTIGEVLTLIAIVKDASNIPYLIFNYSFNLLSLQVIWYYRLFPKRAKNEL